MTTGSSFVWCSRTIDFQRLILAFFFVSSQYLTLTKIIVL